MRVERGEARRCPNKHYGMVIPGEGGNMNGVDEHGNVGAPSPASPVYWRTPMDVYDPPGTQMWMVVCNEGWRESIVCTRMYEWAAEWLVEQLQGKPFAPGKH